MGGIAGEKDAAYAIAIHHPYIDTVKGEPGGIVQADRGRAGSLVDDLLKARERWLIRLVGWNLCLKLKGIGGGKRAEGDPSVFMFRPGVPVVTIEYIHLYVAHQHAFVFPGFAFETNVEMFAEKAATSVCGEVRIAALTWRWSPSRSRVAVTVSVILLDVDEFGGQLDLVSDPARRFLQYLFDAKLGDDEGARIGHIGRGVAAFVHVLVA